MFDGRPINRSMSEGWPRPSQAAVSLKKRAVAIICMVMAVLASGLAVAVDTKTGEYELANYLAPIALKRYLKRIIIKDFTRAASENILSLYNYSAEKISEENSVYTNLALWIAQTSLRSPIIYQFVANGQSWQMDNYFFHWEERMKDYYGLVERCGAKSDVPTVEEFQAMKEKQTREASDRVNRFKDKIAEIKNDFEELRQQLKDLVKNHVARQKIDPKLEKTRDMALRNLHQRLDIVELVFVDYEDIEELSFKVQKALLDSPAINYSGKVYVGPEMYNFPRAAVKLTLAHELAHSIDFMHARKSLDLPQLKSILFVDHPYFSLLGQWEKNKDLDLDFSKNFKNLSSVDQMFWIYNMKSTLDDDYFVQDNFRGNEIFADYLASLVINDDIRKISDPIEQTRYAMEAVMFNMTNAMDLRWIDFKKLIKEGAKSSLILKTIVQHDYQMDIVKRYIKASSEFDLSTETIIRLIDAHLQFSLKSAGNAYSLLPSRVNFYAQPTEIKNALRPDRLRAFQEVYLQELAKLKMRNAI